MVETGILEIKKLEAGAPHADDIVAEQGRAERVAGAPLLRTLVFAGGFASIGVELTASRLLAPYFGSSTFIWASLIGLTLAFLALGYFLGGRLADRRPEPVVLYGVTAIAAVAIGIIPFVSRPLLTGSLEAFRELDAGAFYGSLVGTLLLLAPPVTLLGFISPFAIRLQLSDVASAGKTAGSLYALSTIGSITGSFIPALVLIPLIGTAATFIALSLALLVPSVAGLVVMRAWPVALTASLAAFTVPALALAAPAGVRPPDRGILLDERESAYNYIQVVDEDGRRSLILNDGHAVHSVYDPDELLTGGPWDYFMVAPLMVGERGGSGNFEDAERPRMPSSSVWRAVRSPGNSPLPTARSQSRASRSTPKSMMSPANTLRWTSSKMSTSSSRTDATPEDLRCDIRSDWRRRLSSTIHPVPADSREFFQDVSAHLRPGGVAVVNAGRTQHRLPARRFACGHHARRLSPRRGDRRHGTPTRSWSGASRRSRLML